MPKFQPSHFSQPLPTQGGWEHTTTPAQQDMEALQQSASRALRHVLLTAFAVLLATYVWHAWFH